MSLPFDSAKAYLLYDNGSEYEDYERWVKAILLVPLAFNPDEDVLGFYHRLKGERPEWFREDGQFRRACGSKGNAAYEADLRARFQSIPFVPVPWQLES